MLILPEQVLEEYKAKTKGEINVALPGVVVSYDASTQRANVQPTIRAWYYDDEEDEARAARFPIIPRVPVAFFRAGSFGLSAPLQPGDFVTLLVQDRSIDEFMATGNSDVTPADGRRFDWTDAVAIPNPPAPSPLSTLDPDNLVLGSTNSSLRLSAAGKMALEAGGEELIDLFEQLVDICIAGITGMGVPTFTTQQPDLATLKAKLAAMKL